MRIATIFAWLAGALLLGNISADAAARGAHRVPAQSVAAFQRMDRVLTSPRCQNCHTLTQFPRQGDDRHPHSFNVSRGPDGHGAPGLPCSACHSSANNLASGVPGAQDWHLAPFSMGWEGLSPAARCRQLKDKTHNGGRSGDALIDHLRTSLVRWAWTPGTNSHGANRDAPPLSYDDFIRAAESWVRSGAECPAR